MRIARFLFLLLFSAAFASAQVGSDVSPIFEHDTLNCMSTDDFPVVEAVLDPAELVGLRTAQVYFKAGQTDAWYFVEMEPGEESRLHATLPRPLAETERVDYYLFFLSSTFEPSQTAELSVSVSQTGCGGVPRDATTSPVSVMLRATVANQSPIPPGFGPQGISGLVTTAGNTVTVGSAASGGLSGATIGAVVGGVAAAATAVVVTKGDGDSDTASPDPGQEPTGGAAPTSSSPSPEPEPTPSPTPPAPPAPSLPDVSGTWTMNYRITGSCDPSLVGRTSTTPMQFQQNGTAVTGTRNGPNFTENLAGTIDMAGSIAMRGPFSDESDTGEARIEATTTSGSDMSGRYVRFYPEYDCTIRWALNGSKN